MPFDKKPTLAHRLLGRGTTPLLRQSLGKCNDMFFRPNGMCVSIGRGPIYLMFGPRVNKEKAAVAFSQGLRRPPAGGQGVLAPAAQIEQLDTQPLFATAA